MGRASRFPLAVPFCSTSALHSNLLLTIVIVQIKMQFWNYIFREALGKAS